MQRISNTQKEIEECGHYYNDCKFIQDTLLKNGYIVSLKECMEMWDDYSYKAAAGWLMIDRDEDEDAIVNIAERYFEN